jgi:hypothetical protein
MAAAKAAALRFGIFTQQCFDTLFRRKQLFNVACIKQALPKVKQTTAIYIVVVAGCLDDALSLTKHCSLTNKQTTTKHTRSCLGSASLRAPSSSSCRKSSRLFAPATSRA